MIYRSRNFAHPSSLESALMLYYSRGDEKIPIPYINSSAFERTLYALVVIDAYVGAGIG